MNWTFLFCQAWNKIPDVQLSDVRGQFYILKFGFYTIHMARVIESITYYDCRNNSLNSFLCFHVMAPPCQRWLYCFQQCNKSGHVIITITWLRRADTLYCRPDSNGCQPARFIVWRADNTACQPELQSRYYYYHHIELLWLHSPGCDREKTASSSWPTIVKRCGRDTVVCIVDANNIDGYPIRKIVAKAFIRQKFRGPVTWQVDKARYSGEQAGWQWCCT